MFSRERERSSYAGCNRKGLIPKHLVGKEPKGGGKAYSKSDTFFTVRFRFFLSSINLNDEISGFLKDFVDRHTKDDVLSSTADSLIIGNKASHDVRQYSPKFDPRGKSNDGSAGMSYMHLLVIPRRKGMIPLVSSFPAHRIPFPRAVSLSMPFSYVLA
jgi:hypothetical protein